MSTPELTPSANLRAARAILRGEEPTPLDCTASQRIALVVSLIDEALRGATASQQLFAATGAANEAEALTLVCEWRRRADDIETRLHETIAARELEIVSLKASAKGTGR